MNAPLAAVVSAPAPLPGQSHRSSPYFQFFQSVTSSLAYQLYDAPSNIQAVVMHARGGGESDQQIGSISGTSGSFSLSDPIQPDANYYVADPSAAAGNFVVVFGS